MRSRRARSVTISLAVAAFLCGAPVRAADTPAPEKTRHIHCHMTFNLAGWSAFYKTAKGDGKISCDNGQSADVTIKITGGGLTFGKSKTVDGKGTFSEVADIQETLGAYASSSAHAGAVKSAEAVALTKGEVSLALSGTGHGFDLGVDFGKFTIRARK